MEICGLYSRIGGARVFNSVLRLSPRIILSLGLRDAIYTHDIVFLTSISIVDEPSLSAPVHGAVARQQRQRPRAQSISSTEFAFAHGTP
jgi:hypothetical protein